MDKELQINTFLPEQWKEYKKLRLISLQDEPSAFGSSYEKESKFTDEKWKERLRDEKNKILFYRENNIFVGMAGARLIDNNVAYIIGVYVIKSARRKGIAKKLMEYLIKELLIISDIKILKLSVNAKQIHALTLYKRFNFKIVGKEKSKMGDGNFYDEYLMEILLR
jgi:ribosomal protein S18 acetylase RimI-like enzyme